MATFANLDNTLIRDEEIKSDKGSLPTKRKPELSPIEEENIDEGTDDSNKKLKVGVPSTENNDTSIENNDPLILDVEVNKDVNGSKNHSVHVKQVLGDVDYEDEDEDEDEDEEDYEDEEEEDEEEEEEDDSDDEDSNANAKIVDRKGKGIMRDDKGKGKLVEVSENSSDCGSESDADSDLSDDPLAEVDLDNILPSRTRRRVQRGVYISKNQGNKDDEDDSD